MSIFFTMCSNKQIRSEMDIADQQNPYSIGQNSCSTSHSPSTHHLSPRNTTSNRTEITIACRKIDTISKLELLDVSPAFSLLFKQVTAGIHHDQNVLDITFDSAFAAKLFYLKISSIQECHDVASRTVCRMRNSN